MTVGDASNSLETRGVVAANARILIVLRSCGRSQIHTPIVETVPVDMVADKVWLIEDAENGSVKSHSTRLAGPFCDSLRVSVFVNEPTHAGKRLVVVFVDQGIPRDYAAPTVHGQILEGTVLSGNHDSIPCFSGPSTSEA